MKVFIVGDHRTGSGPANVTKEYIKNFPEKVLYQKMVSKAARVPELILKVMLCDVVIFSGYSRQNLLGIKLAKFFNKKCAYLMHGCVEYENEINNQVDKVMAESDRKTLEGVDAVYAVSERFSKWLKGYFPEYADKFDFVTNVVDGALESSRSDANKDPNMIFSIGGGMPRKKIKHICEAIEILNEKGCNYTLTVVGDKGFDDDIINAYPFVNNLGLVDHKTVESLFDGAALFVQNSCFETFGLAPVEALSRGCSVLLSDAVGALDIIDGTNDNDIIYAYNDKEEIASKIEYIMSNPNAERLADGIDFNEYSWKKRSEVLWEKLRKLQN